MEIIILIKDVILRNHLIKAVQNIDSKINLFITNNIEKVFMHLKESEVNAFFLELQNESYYEIELAKKIRKVKKYHFTPIVFLQIISQGSLRLIDWYVAMILLLNRILEKS